MGVYSWEQIKFFERQRPTDDTFNGWNDVIKDGFAAIERALGSINENGVVTGGDLVFLNQFASIIGSIGNLSLKYPKYGEQPQTISSWPLVEGAQVHILPLFPEINTLANVSGAALGIRKNSLHELTSAGDYYIYEMSSEIAPGIGSRVLYTYQPAQAGDAISFTGHTLQYADNLAIGHTLVPQPAQVTAGEAVIFSAATLTSAGNGYIATLPKITHDWLGNLLPSYLQYYPILDPDIVSQWDGSASIAFQQDTVQMWDVGTSPYDLSDPSNIAAISPDIQFYYEGTDVNGAPKIGIVIPQNVTFDDTKGYIIAFSNNSTNRNIGDIREKLFNHKHDGKDYGSIISHTDLKDNVTSGDYLDGSGSRKSTIIYGHSIIPNHAHTMYLVREGYTPNDPGTHNNSMIGDLVIASTSLSSNFFQNLSANSNKLIFGEWATGPAIYFAFQGDGIGIEPWATDGFLNITNKDMAISGETPNLLFNKTGPQSPPAGDGPVVWRLGFESGSRDFLIEPEDFNTYLRIRGTDNSTKVSIDTSTGNIVVSGSITQQDAGGMSRFAAKSLFSPILTQDPAAPVDVVNTIDKEGLRVRRYASDIHLDIYGKLEADKYFISFNASNASTSSGMTFSVNDFTAFRVVLNGTGSEANVEFLTRAKFLDDLTTPFIRHPDYDQTYIKFDQDTNGNRDIETYSQLYGPGIKHSGSRIYVGSSQVLPYIWDENYDTYRILGPGADNVPINNGARNANLNADMLDDLHSYDFAWYEWNINNAKVSYTQFDESQYSYVGNLVFLVTVDAYSNIIKTELGSLSWNGPVDGFNLETSSSGTCTDGFNSNYSWNFSGIPVDTVSILVRQVSFSYKTTTNEYHSLTNVRVTTGPFWNNLNKGTEQFTDYLLATGHSKFLLYFDSYFEHYNSGLNNLPWAVELQFKVLRHGRAI